MNDRISESAHETSTSLTAPSRFSSEEVDRFRREGFVIVRNLAGSGLCERMKATALRDLAGPVEPVEYESDTHYPGAPASRDAPGGRAVRRLMQAAGRDSIFRDWALSDMLAGRLTQLLGPAVAMSQAHHNCVMTKNPAFSSVTGWHQDIRYWSFARPDLASAWLALGPERGDNGCLLLVPGSHLLELRRDQYDEAFFFRTDTEENQKILSRQMAAELDAGDVLFFHARLLHAAGRNHTGLSKLAVVFTYHASDNRPLPGTRSDSLPDIPLE